VAGKGFADALSGENEITITFVKSKDGKKRTIPIWFTIEKGKMELLPMYGLKTRWFRDIEKSGRVEVKVKDQRMQAVPRIVRDRAAVEEVKERFSQKYGKADVDRYYPMPEVSLEVQI
jgi:hypothetical protein